eukprot:scaffold17883_cov36-Tisochrysis_lutea.AAC.5
MPCGDIIYRYTAYAQHMKGKGRQEAFIWPHLASMKNFPPGSGSCSCRYRYQYRWTGHAHSAPQLGTAPRVAAA